MPASIPIILLAWITTMLGASAYSYNHGVKAAESKMQQIVINNTQKQIELLNDKSRQISLLQRQLESASHGIIYQTRTIVKKIVESKVCDQNKISLDAVNIYNESLKEE